MPRVETLLGGVGNELGRRDSGQTPSDASVRKPTGADLRRGTRDRPCGGSGVRAPRCGGRHCGYRPGGRRKCGCGDRRGGRRRNRVLLRRRARRVRARCSRRGGAPHRRDRHRDEQRRRDPLGQSGGHSDRRVAAHPEPQSPVGDPQQRRLPAEDDRARQRLRRQHRLVRRTFRMRRTARPTSHRRRRSSRCRSHSRSICTPRACA